uniref:RRM domain-containing protein n=1 Tax=Rhizochromulina marina TaxID=1034831 RepID=A0A7S2RTR2_9STRA|mmetsp:Transcript_20401/g.59607  ORF Transcript_20401/g.59607 Transcript_20401/m.59607 type:complete len:354 (+) Transcript_20401:38-1099(+)
MRRPSKKTGSGDGGSSSRGRARHRNRGNAKAPPPAAQDAATGIFGHSAAHLTDLQIVPPQMIQTMMPMHGAQQAAPAASSSSNMQYPGFPTAQQSYYYYAPPVMPDQASAEDGPGAPIQLFPHGYGPQGCNLFVFHIPNDMTNFHLFHLFSPFGVVTSARIMVDQSTGRSRGFGFVSFDNTASAEVAVASLNGFQIGKKRLKVQFKKDPYDLTAHGNSHADQDLSSSSPNRRRRDRARSGNYSSGGAPHDSREDRGANHQPSSHGEASDEEAPKGTGSDAHLVGEVEGSEQGQAAEVEVSFHSSSIEASQVEKPRDAVAATVNQEENLCQAAEALSFGTLVDKHEATECGRGQ